ncbi:MAG: hypothetical protein ABW136_04615, partial [Steroidobacteraceae bacterium]
MEHLQARATQSMPPVQALLAMASNIRNLLRTCSESGNPAHEDFCVQMAHTLTESLRELADQAFAQQGEVAELRVALRGLEEALAQR